MVLLLPKLFIIIILRVATTKSSNRRCIGTKGWLFSLFFGLSSMCCFSLVLRPTIVHNQIGSSSTPSNCRNSRWSAGGSSTVCTTVALFGFKKRKVVRNEVEQSSAVQISPDLAKWVASTAATESNDPSTTQAEEEKRVIKKKRRNASTSSTDDAATLENEAQQQYSAELVKKLEALLQQPKRDIAQLLNVVHQLTLQQSEININNKNNAYLWFEGPKVRNYRTVGRKRIETIEVIRILGPFPNIRNSLSGQVKVMTDARSSQSTAATTTTGRNTNRKSIRIVYDRMVDGLGKEIATAPNKERSFILDILHVSDSAIVCSVPNNDQKDEKQKQSREDLNTADIGSGSSLLILVAENDLNTQLETLRVA